MGYRKSKKLRLNRLLAASLAAVMAFSALPSIHPAAKAAGPYVRLRTSFKTLKVGQTNRMTLKNNTLGWKITKVSTNDRTIAMVYGKQDASFMIKGKSAGRTTVKAKLKTTARKKFTTKTVRCRVKVITQNPAEMSASSQAELETALQNPDLKKLEIKTSQSAKLTIPKGTYQDVELTVDAPAADIENNGVFKSITIQAIKPDTWIENAVGNVMKVVSEAARIVVNAGARLSSLNFARADAKASLEVNGMIDEISISAKMELKISGKPEAPITTVIEETAEGTVLETSAPLNVVAHASADITFNEGAEDSTVEIKSDKAKVEVKNNTRATITIKNADGTVVKKTGRLNMSAGLYQGSSSGSYTPPSVYYPPVTGPAVVPTGPSVIPDDSTDEGGDSGGPGYYNKLNTEVMLAILNPAISIVVTRGAIATEPGVETETEAVPVTMSAILSFNLDPDANPDGLKSGFQLMWKWETAGFIGEGSDLTEEDYGEGFFDWRKITKKEKAVALELEDVDYNSFESDGGFTASLLYDPDEEFGFHDIAKGIVIFKKKALDSVIQEMEEQNWTTAELEITCRAVMDWLTYDYDDIIIKNSR